MFSPSFPQKENKENKVSPSSGLVSCRLEDQQLEGNSRREAIINEIFS